MSPRNDYITGLRQPSEHECRRIWQAWNAGTNAGGIRKMQGILLAFVVVMAALRAMGGEEGFDLGAGIASGLVILLLSSPVFIVWKRQISKINRRAELLSSGRFVLTTAQGERAVVNRWNVYYVGFADAKMADGSILRNVEMPYRHAADLQKTRKVFSAYVVMIDGEKKPVMIPC